MPTAIRLLAVAALLLRLPSPADAQPARGATVHAIVHDSLSGGRLAGATVQLVSVADPGFTRTAETDSAGTLSFVGIPVGRYRVGFLHPLLDELGVTAPDRELRVEGDEAHRVELAVPSPSRLRVAVCGPRAADDSAAAVVGTVRDPRDRMPLADAAVTAQWMEITVGGAGIQQRAPRITARTGPNGWFALCALPPGLVTVSVRQGSDSVPRVDLQMAAREFRRRDLYLSAAGVGQLRGSIVSADSARPIAGARVSVLGGPQTVSGPGGEWTLRGVPLGTRALEVRAVGYHPEQRAVDVIADAPPTTVALTTFRATLDAIRVTAQRLGRADMGGFASRARRSGMGRYMDADQIARRNVLETSDLLKTMPGFVGDGSLAMKGNFSDGAGGYDVNCTAEVYVDGHLFRGISASELDALVKPEHIEGLEVFAVGAPRPPQFDSGMSGCGSLVIWQKPFAQRAPRRE